MWRHHTVYSSTCKHLSCLIKDLEPCIRHHHEISGCSIFFEGLQCLICFSTRRFTEYQTSNAERWTIITPGATWCSFRRSDASLPCAFTGGYITERNISWIYCDCWIGHHTGTHVNLYSAYAYQPLLKCRCCECCAVSSMLLLLNQKMDSLDHMVLPSYRQYLDSK